MAFTVFAYFFGLLFEFSFGMCTLEAEVGSGKRGLGVCVCVCVFVGGEDKGLRGCVRVWREGGGVWIG